MKLMVTARTGCMQKDFKGIAFLERGIIQGIRLPVHTLVHKLREDHQRVVLFPKLHRPGRKAVPCMLQPMLAEHKCDLIRQALFDGT